MFDILTLLTAVWFAIIALILAQIFSLVPYPRIRLLLPMVSGILLGLVILISNPSLESGYRGQMMYIGPFCFPLLVPLLISVPLIFFWKGDGILKGKTVEFFGAWVSAFLFLTLYQSKFFFRIFPEVMAFSILIGSTLVITSGIFFLIERSPRFFPDSRNETEVKHDQQPKKKKPQADLKLIGLLVIYLLASLSPLYFIDFVNNHDRSTMGHLTVYLPDPSVTPNGSVIHLTEENLQAYPQLKSLIKKNNPGMRQGSAIRTDNKMSTVTNPDMVRISCEEESQMRNDWLIGSYYFPAVYLEFENTLYVAEIMHYAGEYCQRISLFS